MMLTEHNQNRPGKPIDTGLYIEMECCDRDVVIKQSHFSFNCRLCCSLRFWGWHASLKYIFPSTLSNISYLIALEFSRQASFMLENRMLEHQQAFQNLSGNGNSVVCHLKWGRKTKEMKLKTMWSASHHTLLVTLSFSGYQALHK